MTCLEWRLGDVPLEFDGLSSQGASGEDGLSLSALAPVRVSHRDATGCQVVSHGASIEPEPLADLFNRLTRLVAAGHLLDVVGRRGGVADSYPSLPEQFGKSNAADFKLGREVPELGPVGVPSFGCGELPFARLNNLTHLATRAFSSQDRAESS